MLLSGSTKGDCGVSEFFDLEVPEFVDFDSVRRFNEERQDVCAELMALYSRLIHDYTDHPDANLSAAAKAVVRSLKQAGADFKAWRAEEEAFDGDAGRHRAVSWVFAAREEAEEAREADEAAKRGLR